MKKYISRLFLVSIMLITLVGGISARPVGPGGVLNFNDSVWMGLNGKYASAELSGYSFQKKVSACVGSCTTSAWVPASRYSVSVTDVGSFFDTAYTYFDYRK